MREVTVGILGAVGAVGQRYVSMLSSHPYLKIGSLMGRRSAGKAYSEAARWILPGRIPEASASMHVMEATPGSADGCDVIFSALPSEAARELEPKFAREGFMVISEASAHRMDEDVPLIIPEVNPDHLSLLKEQRKRRGWKRGMVTTPNCTATGLVMVMKPLLDTFGLGKTVVTTMQAVSGAGWDGVPSMAILENVIPFVDGEEEKVVREAQKMLGTMTAGGLRQADVPMSVACNRVPTMDGHLETLYCETARKAPAREVVRVLRGYRSVPQKLGLPTAPKEPIIVMDEQDRPQPRLDRMAGSVPGMSVVVGRVRNGFDESSLQMVVLSHNTVRGAAGTAILTAEMMASSGYLE
ncbi:MAG: aspartate-semialdehyde dehydrogenase [Nitrososphaerota archaeon]|nr:aspartate-semialdehyde dehydrogenase [Nitrososphaerota archaeon]MDG6938819.1 aspartate-semialdehyde dehydrogenase [Nitrososphaerota archaeon]